MPNGAHPPFRGVPVVRCSICGFLYHVDEIRDNGRGSFTCESCIDEPGYRERLSYKTKEHPLSIRIRRRRRRAIYGN